MADDKQDKTEKTDAPKKHWFFRYVSPTFIIAVLVIGYILFYSDYSIIKQKEQADRIEELEAVIKLYQDSLQYYQKLHQDLRTSPEELEKIVREKYMMHRKNEDVYEFE